MFIFGCHLISHPNTLILSRASLSDGPTARPSLCWMKVSFTKRVMDMSLSFKLIYTCAFKPALYTLSKVSVITVGILLSRGFGASVAKWLEHLPFT